MTSTLSVVNIGSVYNWGEGVSDVVTADSIEYDDISYSSLDDGAQGDDIVYSYGSIADIEDSFEIIPEEGQEKIGDGKDQMEILRGQTDARIQNVKNGILDKLGSRSSNYPLLGSLLVEDTSEENTAYDESYSTSDGDTVSNPPSSGSMMMGTSSTGEADDSDNVSVDENITIVPDSGRIFFMGFGSIGLNTVLNINGTIVTVSGYLYLGYGPDVTTVDLLWNLSQGYFEITGDGYFEFSNLYLNINDSIVFVTDSLIIDAFGHIMIDNHGFDGDIGLDGVLALAVSYTHLTLPTN